MLRLLVILVTLAGVASEEPPLVGGNATPAVTQWRTELAGVTVYRTEPEGQRSTSGEDAVRSWVVRMHPASSSSDVTSFGSMLRSAGASRVLTGHPSDGGLAMVVVQARESQLEEALRGVGGSVRYIEQDAEFRVAEQSNPPSWGLDRIDDADGLDGSYTGSGTHGGKDVHVYVMDTGIRTTHQEFEGRAIPTLESLDNGVVVCNSSDTSCANDGHGHGTHCAGTVGSRAYGVAKAATLHAVQVLSASGSGSLSGILLAMDWIATHGQRPAVVSMSLGAAGVYESFKDSIDSLVSSGIVVVVAAGNSDDDSCRYSPAFVPSAITVGATDSEDFCSYYSNYGSCLDMFAPGSDITSAWKTSDTASRTISGTSMACPHVAGAAALLLGVTPSASPTDVRDTLVSAATRNALSCAKPNSPNLLLFTPHADDNAPITTSIATTTTSIFDTTSPAATTTSIFGGGLTCRCQCVCECTQSSAALSAEIAEQQSLSSSSGDDGEGASIGLVTKIAGGGLATMALIGVGVGSGYLVGRWAGTPREEVQLTPAKV